MGIIKRRIKGQHVAVHVCIRNLSFLIPRPKRAASQPWTVGPRRRWQFSTPDPTIPEPYSPADDDARLLQKCCFVGEEPKVKSHLESSGSVVHEFPRLCVFGGSLD